MFLYIKTNILRGYGIFKNDFAHPREPANNALHWHKQNHIEVIELKLHHIISQVCLEQY